jgi:hypothetical protein
VRKSRELRGLKVANNILFGGSFVTVAFQRSADKITRAQADRQGKCEHNSAK